MNYTDIARLIPKEYRDEILETNMIANAVGIPSDTNMHYLHTIWKNYVDSGIGSCGVCYQEVLRQFREIQENMIELKKQESMLADL